MESLEDFGQKQNKIKSQKKKGIEYRTFWNSINKHNYYSSEKKFNITNYISKHGIWLPSNFDLNKKKIKYICEVINGTFMK